MLSTNFFNTLLPFSLVDVTVETVVVAVAVAFVGLCRFSEPKSTNWSKALLLLTQNDLSKAKNKETQKTHLENCKLSFWD